MGKQPANLVESPRSGDTRRVHPTRRRRTLNTRTLIPILLVAFVLRVWGLADHNIWWDEGIGVWLSRMPALEAIRWTAGDVHPPLYYVLLHAWRAVAGEGEFNLRFLSVIFSLLTVPLVFRLGKALGGSGTGILAAGLLTVSRFSIWWSQEIRMYAPAAMFATASLWSAVWLWRTGIAGRRRRWVAWGAYVATTLGSLASLYLTATVPVVTNVGFLAFWWQRHRRGKATRVWGWVTAQMAVVALFLPWALYALPRMHAWSSDAPYTLGFFVQLYGTILAVGNPLDLDANAVWVVGAFAGLAVGMVAVVRQIAARPDWTKPEQPRAGRLVQSSPAPDRISEATGGLAMLVAGLVLPPAVVAIVSLPGLRFAFSRPLVPRYLLPLAACYVTLLAWGIVVLWTGTRRRFGPGRWLAVGAAGLAAAAAVAGLLSYYPGRTQHDDYVTIAEVLNAQRRVDEAVVLYVDRDWPIFTAHYAGLRTDLAYGAALSDPAVTEALLQPIWEQTAAIWLVSTPESLQTDPAQAVPQWLAAHSVMSQTVVSGEASLTFYTRTPDRVPVHEMVVPGYVVPTDVTSSYGLVGASVPLSRYSTGDTVHLGLYWIPPLPDGAEVLASNGTDELRFAVPPVPATTNIVRNQVDLPLTPDLSGGAYRLSVVVPGSPPTPVGTFTLVRKAVGAATTPEAIPTTVDYRFGDKIRLIGYALPRTEVTAGDRVALTLYWQAEAPVEARYKVFAHLLGETFNAETGTFLWGQQDNEPAGGQAPTTLWAPGTVIADAYLLPVDPDAPPGTYTLEVGMYGLLDGVRLPVVGPDGAVADGAVRLAEVTVQGGE